MTVGRAAGPEWIPAFAGMTVGGGKQKAPLSQKGGWGDFPPPRITKALIQQADLWGDYPPCGGLFISNLNKAARRWPSPSGRGLGEGETPSFNQPRRCGDLRAAPFNGAGTGLAVTSGVDGRVRLSLTPPAPAGRGLGGWRPDMFPPSFRAAPPSFRVAAPHRHSGAGRPPPSFRVAAPHRHSGLPPPIVIPGCRPPPSFRRRPESRTPAYR